MTQEEKAKRYDEAIERARAFNSGEDVDIKAGTTFCEYIFLELKESEDDRIKKELTDFVKSRLAGFPECCRFIAWLEKQDIFSKKDVDDAYLKGITDAKNEIEKQYKANYQIRKDIATFLFNYKSDIKDRAKWMNYLGVSFVEKQDERKPTDKVKPKFNVGDWVIHGCNILKIRCVGNEYYCIETVGGYVDNMLISEIDSLYHLWTIQDAKEGDVLFHSDSASNGIFIFKEIVQHGDIQEVTCYCDYDSEDGFRLGEYHTCCWVDSKILHPATKKQRDLLFIKMKEAGYEWDVAYPHKSANWREKYEKIRQTIINEFEQCSEWYCSNGLTKKDCINWLNKQEYFEWSDEDNENMNSLFVLLDQVVSINAIGNEHSVEYKNWLKSIKERMGGISYDTRK